ncbi:MAG: hypothetical protein WC709_08610 [Thermoleophilia bacterium]
MEQIAPGISRWSAPHPEWRPRLEEVNSYALVVGEALAVVDPILPAQDDARRAPLLAELDELVDAARRLELLVTVPYHTRSAESLYERYARRRPTLIWGHPAVKKRLTRLAPLELIPQSAAGEAAEIADGAALAFTIGRPRRSEYPLYFPALRAVAFGDAVVGAEGGVRFWNLSSGTGAGWYRDIFAPTLRRLAEQDIEYVLVTHGPAVLSDGRRALAECLAAPPVDHY